MYDNEMNRNPRIEDERGFDDDYGYYCQPPQNNSIGKLVVALLVLFAVWAKRYAKRKPLETYY